MYGLLNAAMLLPLTFDIDQFASNLYERLRTWGGWLMIIIGVVMMIVAIWQVGKGLIQHGKANTNWAVAIALLIIGGALASFGANGALQAFQWVEGIAAGGKATIDSMGGGGNNTTTIIMNGLLSGLLH